MRGLIHLHPTGCPAPSATARPTIFERMLLPTLGTDMLVRTVCLVASLEVEIVARPTCVRQPHQLFGRFGHPCSGPVFGNGPGGVGSWCTCA